MKQLINGVMAGLIAMGITSNAMAQEKKESWTDSIKMGGDVRFRYQSTDEEGKDRRERWRFRGRLALDAKVNDEVKAGVRLVTNTGDPISDNQTMDNSFDDKNVAIDRAFFKWTPESSPVSLCFGKMGQPWITVNDLVMSAEVNPEGIAANAKLGSEMAEILLHGGAFVLDERSSDDETMLYSGQAALKVPLAGKNSIMVGATIYMYDNVEGFGLLGPDSSKAYGNTTVTLDDEDVVYATDYSIMEGFVQLDLQAGNIPVTLGSQYMVNTEADDDDTGYLGMFSAKLSKDFSVGYQYRHLEKDSTLGVFGESTDFGNGTDLKGHIPYIKYKIGKNFDIKVQYATGTKGLDNGKDIDTFKIDLACKF